MIHLSKGSLYSISERGLNTMYAEKALEQQKQILLLSLPVSLVPSSLPSGDSLLFFS